jgi:hypothetical protein
LTPATSDRRGGAYNAHNQKPARHVMTITLAGATRRQWLRGTGGTVLSAGALALIAGCETRATAATGRAAAAPGGDAEILNTALDLEYQAIAAYQVGADSKLLTPATLAVAVAFQGDHRAHAQLLDATVRKLGGRPVAPKTAAQYGFPLPRLATERDVVSFAASLEQSAATAYLNAVPRFADGELAKAAASILGAEAMHWAALRQALGEPPVPAPFIASA